MSGIPSWAVRGAKVVCVDDGPLRGGWGNEAMPVKGAVYTVRMADRHGLRLSEIVNPVRDYIEGAMECGYAFNRFRPLVSTKTEAEDVAMFRDLIRQPEAA